MTTTIAMLNHKGGVGKTTCTAFIAYSLARLGKSVLLLDCDPQSNLTRDMGFNPEEIDWDETLANAIRNKLDRKAQTISSFDFVVGTKYDSIDMLVGTQDMREIREEIIKAYHRGIRVFKRIIADIIKEKEYDYILMDMLPGLGPENTQVLLAADYILIPTDSDRNAIEGLRDVFEFYNDCIDSNEDLKILGIIANKFKMKDSYHVSALKYLKSLYGELVLDTIIEDSNVAAKIASEGLKYKKNKSYVAYDALTREIIDRIG